MKKNIKINIEVSKEGFLKVDANGLKGKACIDTITNLLHGIGLIYEMDKTHEFFEEVSIEELNQVENKIQD